MTPHPELPSLDASSFWPAVRAYAKGARGSGTLQPISTRRHHVADRSIEFVVRVSDNLRRKRRVGGSYEQPGQDNPFLRPDPSLTVGELAPRHIAVLNKFNVIDDHVLVISREFVHQETPLTQADFSAVAAGLSSGAGLAFYNAGRAAGASQPHRHFQLVPLPLDGTRDIPAAPLFEDADDGIDTAPALGFRHAFMRLDADVHDADAFGRCCLRAYRHALAGLGLLGDSDTKLPSRLAPYNLLLTHRWLFVVPRAVEHCEGISVNGLAYAGSLFVASTQGLERIRRLGAMTLLERVSKPREEG